MLRVSKLPKIELSSYWLAIILAAYITLFLNDQLWHSLTKIEASFSASTRWQFFGLIGVALIAAQALIFSILLWSRTLKPISLLILLSAIGANYFAYNYGTHFDSTMLRNIFATNFLEAKELLTASLILDYLKHLPLILFVIFFLKVREENFKRTVLKRLASMGILSVVLVLSIFSQLKNLSSTVSNHKELGHLVIPTSYLSSTIEIVTGSGKLLIEEKRIIDDAIISETDKSKKKLVVLVIGETVRAQNWGLSGYERETTPELKSKEVINYPYAKTCGTNTEVSLPCMFSPYGKKNYDEKKIRTTESFLHILHRNSIPTSWIDNQSGCKGVCDGLDFLQARNIDNGDLCVKDGNCFDEILIKELDKKIDLSLNQQMITLHPIGNHGPAYHSRYPKKFEKFTPACNTSDLEKCTNAQIVNAYDNAILYTDSVMSQMIDHLSKISDREVYLIYASDHGESLGENNLFLHGLPYRIAPDFQTRAPFFIWLGGKAKQIKSCVNKTANTPISHDNLYHTILSIFAVNSHTVEANMNLIKGCRIEYANN
jgi:lipid A ethanolaminephosphotransferase